MVRPIGYLVRRMVYNLVPHVPTVVPLSTTGTWGQHTSIIKVVISNSEERTGEIS